MKLSIKDAEIVSKWFEIASEYEDLKAKHLKLYDKICEFIEESDYGYEEDDDEDDEISEIKDSLNFKNEDDEEYTEEDEN